jgi:uncharacterized protein
VGKILVTGATGLIGSRLLPMFRERGHDVAHIGRQKTETEHAGFIWDIQKHYLDPRALENVDTIIHLAGAGIADKPWTEARKREILESRTHSTRLLFQELKKRNHQVKTFVAASAIGYYGFESGERMLTETDPPGNDFLADVVRKWEAEVDQIETLGVRVVKVRIGIVLSNDGGALKEMAKPVRFSVGAPLGKGTQGISWIHIDDLCRIFVHVVENSELTGAFNGAGPYPVTNRELTEAIAKTLGKRILLPPVPAFVMRLLLGEMADLVLKGSRVSSQKIQDTGFRFQFNTLESALSDLLKK